MNKNNNNIIPSKKYYQPVRVSQPNINISKNIIPELKANNRNIAGQVSTRIKYKDNRGNEVTYYQNQQLLNLLQGNTGNWFMTDNYRGNYKRRKK